MANSLVNLVDDNPHILDDWKQIIKKLFRVGFKVIMYSFLYFTFHYVYNLDSRQLLFGFKTAKRWNMYIMAARNEVEALNGKVHYPNFP